jgi:hypothetical protein
MSTSLYNSSVAIATGCSGAQKGPCRRLRRLGGKRRIQQVADSSNLLSDAQRHCRRAAQRFMQASEIVERDVHGDGGKIWKDQRDDKRGRQPRGLMSLASDLPNRPDALFRASARQGLGG